MNCATLKQKVSYDPPHRDFHVDKPFEKLTSEGGARDQTIESTIANYKIPVIIRRTKVIIISEPGGNVKALITDRIRPAEYHREAILSII